MYPNVHFCCVWLCFLVLSVNMYKGNNTSASVLTGSQRNCATQLYKCGSGECVDTSLVCNRITNCADGSDEGEGCVQRNCSSQSAPQCDHHCVSTPNGPVSVQNRCGRCFVPNLSSICINALTSKLLLAGILELSLVYETVIFDQPVAARNVTFVLFPNPSKCNLPPLFLQRCYCATGFQLRTSAMLCMDIDECNAVPHVVCKHGCRNTHGSYVCHCFPGFYMEPDNKSCKTKGAVCLDAVSALRKGCVP